MSDFREENSNFYDLEYFISMEYRYLSGAHSSKVNNIFKLLGDIKNKKALDVGCGGGFLANEMSKRGADVLGIDYSKYAIDFSRERYPDLNFEQVSGYNLEMFPSNGFDIVTLFDVIEHVGDQGKFILEIKRVLKSGGLLVITTDVEGGLWGKKNIVSFIRRTNYFSKAGRAYLFIKDVEKTRRKYKNYHASHVSTLSYYDIENILNKNNFKIIKHSIYPLVAVPLRDFFLGFLPKRYRGDHQCAVAINKK